MTAEDSWYVPLDPTTPTTAQFALERQEREGFFLGRHTASKQRVRMFIGTNDDQNWRYRIFRSNNTLPYPTKPYFYHHTEGGTVWYGEALGSAIPALDVIPLGTAPELVLPLLRDAVVFLEAMHASGFITGGLRCSDVFVTPESPHSFVSLAVSVRWVRRHSMRKLSFEDERVQGLFFTEAGPDAAMYRYHTAETDTYSMAALIVRWLTGQELVPNDLPLITKITKLVMEPLVLPWLPKKLSEVLLAALAREPKDRCSLEELRKGLLYE